MPIGAITLGDVAGLKPSAPTFLLEMSFAGDNAYPAGGTPDITDLIQEAIQTMAATMPDANVRGRIDMVPIAVVGYDAGQYVPYYDTANDKLFVRDGGSGAWAEVAPAADLSGTVFTVVFALQ